MSKYLIGIDIGGTHTDAVLVDSQNQMIAQIKTPTTLPVEEGIRNAIAQLPHLSNISQVLVGTTHATNAILERKGLYKVGLLRLMSHHCNSIPPCMDWPQDLKDQIFIGHQTIAGGYECDGKESAKISKEDVQKALQELLQKGAESIAIVGAFSPLCREQEEFVAREIQKNSSIPLSLSQELGGLGILERENSALLNAALKKPLSQGFAQIQSTLQKLGMDCPLFLTQNNGSFLELEQALQYPILTLSSGPTNSFMGATKLADLTEAVIVDIGGTSTDIGLVQQGFCRRSLGLSNIGGVRLNFSMPDVLSIPMGGGSLIQNKQIGPSSVGAALYRDAQCFGGTLCTLTDVAVTLGYASISKANGRAVQISPSEAQEVFLLYLEQIHSLVQRISGKNSQAPVLIVGGGASLLRNAPLPPRYRIIEKAPVANAYGAAQAELSVSCDKIVCIKDRQEALRKCKEELRSQAMERAANLDQLRITEQEVLPLHYLPGDLARIKMSLAAPRAT